MSASHLVTGRCDGPPPQGRWVSVCCDSSNTAPGLLFAAPARCPNQTAVKKALDVLRAFYGWPLAIESDWGTHSIGQEIQQ